MKNYANTRGIKEPVVWINISWVSSSLFELTAAPMSDRVIVCTEWSPSDTQNVCISAKQWQVHSVEESTDNIYMYEPRPWEHSPFLFFSIFHETDSRGYYINKTNRQNQILFSSSKCQLFTKHIMKNCFHFVLLSMIPKYPDIS